MRAAGHGQSPASGSWLFVFIGTLASLCFLDKLAKVLINGRSAPSVLESFLESRIPHGTLEAHPENASDPERESQLSALSAIRKLLRSAANDRDASPVAWSPVACGATRTPRATRVVDLNALKVSVRPTELDRRHRAARGLVAEMTERQAGL